jgi:hypothetical protein
VAYTFNSRRLVAAALCGHTTGEQKKKEKRGDSPSFHGYARARILDKMSAADSLQRIVQDLGVLLAETDLDAAAGGGGGGGAGAEEWQELAAVRSAAATATPPSAAAAALAQADALLARAQAAWGARLAALRQGSATTAATETQQANYNPLCDAEADADVDADAAVAAQSDELQREAARAVRDAVSWARTLLFQRLEDALDQGCREGEHEDDDDSNARWGEVRALFLELARLDGAVVRCLAAGGVEWETAAAAAFPDPEQQQPPAPHQHHHRRRRGGGCARRRRHRRHRRHWEGDDDRNDHDHEPQRAPLCASKWRSSSSVSDADDDDRLSALSDDDGQGAADAEPCYPGGPRNPTGPQAPAPTPPAADARAGERAASRLLDLQEAALRAAAAELCDLWPSVEASARAHARTLAQGLSAALCRRAARLRLEEEQQQEGDEGQQEQHQPPPLFAVDPALPPGCPLLPCPPPPELFFDAVDLEALLASVVSEQRERLVAVRETTAWAPPGASAGDQDAGRGGRSTRRLHHHRSHHHQEPRRPRCCLRRGFLCRLLFGDEDEDGEDDKTAAATPPPSYAPPLQPHTTRASQAFDMVVVSVDVEALRARLLAAAEEGCAAAERAAERAASEHAAGRVGDAAAQARALVAASRLRRLRVVDPEAAAAEDAAARLEARCGELARLRERVGAMVAARGGGGGGGEDEGGGGRGGEGAAPRAASPPSAEHVVVDLLMADAPPPPPLARAPASLGALVAANDPGTEEGDVVSADDDGWTLVSPADPARAPTP